MENYIIEIKKIQHIKYLFYCKLLKEYIDLDLKKNKGDKAFKDTNSRKKFVKYFENIFKHKDSNEELYITFDDYALICPVFTNDKEIKKFYSQYRYLSSSEVLKKKIREQKLKRINESTKK